MSSQDYPSSDVPNRAPEIASPPRSAAAVERRLFRLAERQERQGRPDAAIETLGQARRGGADGYVCMLRIAAIQRARRRWSEAFAAAEEARRLQPDLLPARELIMSLALDSGDCERAVTLGRSLLKTWPSLISAHNTLGAAYVQMGDTDAAMRVASALIRLDPEASAHHFKLALLCRQKGETALAVQEFMSALQLEPDGPHADAARDALEILDTYQLNQIITLAVEDTAFRTKLARDAVSAVTERGFYLSDIGKHTLIELSTRILPEYCEPCRSMFYN